MKFKIERNFLVRTEEYLELNPKDFLHCATIAELHDEIDDRVSELCTHPIHPNLTYSEELGCCYHDNWPYETIDTKSFYEEWQRLKGLPKEL